MTDSFKHNRAFVQMQQFLYNFHIRSIFSEQLNIVILYHNRDVSNFLKYIINCVNVSVFITQLYFPVCMLSKMMCTWRFEVLTAVDIINIMVVWGCDVMYSCRNSFWRNYHISQVLYHLHWICNVAGGVFGLNWIHCVGKLLPCLLIWSPSILTYKFFCLGWWKHYFTPKYGKLMFRPTHKKNHLQSYR